MTVIKETIRKVPEEVMIKRLVIGIADGVCDMYEKEMFKKKNELVKERMMSETSPQVVDRAVKESERSARCGIATEKKRKLEEKLGGKTPEEERKKTEEREAWTNIWQNAKEKESRTKKVAKKRIKKVDLKKEDMETGTKLKEWIRQVPSDKSDRTVGPKIKKT